ncbi:transporter substrate-binding domain-containing protein [Maridesulfovibrio zosterae]|uniref:transporter substrate-binding domain-containing protein n=1 Tax=Maridesulfovibrio zosterae TaxID=82171 RepID=UPI00146C2F5E|nr:transporter substrate-binding domain-containing protein [Maridesulfovibrio zosterae]
MNRILGRVIFFIFLFTFAFRVIPAFATSLEQVRKTGVLRHIGIPYANFVIEKGQGLDVEVMQRFAKHLGVKYKLVLSNWMRVFGDLTGELVRAEDGVVKVVGHTEVRGDVIACGLTMLKWRKQLVDFSNPTFPTQVWGLARYDYPANPVNASGNIAKDLAAIKRVIKGRKILGKESTCLTPSLYGIDQSVGQVMDFPGLLNDMVFAVLKGVVDVTLLDVPDMMVALEKYPEKLKVLGPISREQEMAAAFSHDSPKLRNEFNLFFDKLKQSGEYGRLVKKYYHVVFKYYPDFFREENIKIH